MREQADMANGSPTVERLLRPREVARMLGVSPSEVSRLVKTRALPFYRLGTSVRKRGQQEVTVEHVRFFLADVLEFLKRKRVERT